MPRRQDEDFQREIESHIAFETDRLIAEGLSPADARDLATRRFGNQTRVQESFYESRRVMWLDQLRQDLRHALRTFTRTPGFAIVTVFTLALAIGLNTAIFSIVDGVLLRPLALPHADRLVRVFEANPAQGQSRADVSLWNFADWRRLSRSFEVLAAFRGRQITFVGPADPEPIIGMVISRDFFAAVGTTFALGGPFPSEEYASLANAAFAQVSPPVTTGVASVIISHALWQRQFGGDPNVIGRRVMLNAVPAVVVGVTQYSTFNETALGAADCWVPLVESLEQYLPGANLRRSRQLTVIGRLKPDVTLSNAQAEMLLLAADLARAHPAENNGWSAGLTSLHESIVGEAKGVLLVLLTGVACVLVIACANVANLFLLRGVGRAREIAVRTALGAGRTRLMRQWLTESTVLAVVGGLLGLALSFWMVPVLVRYAPASLPRMQTVSVDERVFLFCVLVSLTAGILSGLAPTLTGNSNSAANMLRAMTNVAAPRGLWLRHALVVAQVGVAIVLLVVAGLMSRTLMNLHALDLGFDPENVLTFGVDLPGERYRGLSAIRGFSRDLISQLEAIPGIEAAGIGAAPFQVGAGFAVRSEAGGTPFEALVDVPSPGYFRALRFRLLEGRFFQDDDTASSAPVVIVNRALARTLWGTDHVVGRQIWIRQPDPLTVVGVVSDARMTTLEAQPVPLASIPFAQSRIATYSTFVLRTRDDPARVIPQVRKIVRDMDTTVAVTRVATMTERLYRFMAARTFNGWLIGLYSIVALVLAIVGLYAILSEAVASRTAEIGVRVALGARRAEVIRLVIARSLIVTFAGVVLGVGTAAGLTRYLESMLFGLTALDGVVFSVAPLVFLAVALVAAAIPARRAANVDPVVALRCE